jgi:hypothetical protein
MKSRASVVLLAIGVVCNISADAGEIVISKAVLMSEGKSNWIKYRDFSRLLSGTTDREINRDGNLVSHLANELYQNQACRRLVINPVFHARTKDQRVLCQNPDYYFRLSRPLAGKDWALTTVILDKDLAAKAFDSDTLQLLRFGIDDLVRIGPQLDLVALLEYDRLKAVDVSMDTVEGKNYAKVAFDCRHDLERKPFVPFQSGVLWLDPNSFWCLKRAELKVSYSNGEGTEEITCTYRTNREGVPIPERIVNKATLFEHGKMSQTVQNSVYKVALNAQSDADFYMSAFGLREPMGITPPSPPRWNLWIGLTGMGTLVASVLLYRHLKRRGTTSSIAKS